MRKTFVRPPEGETDGQAPLVALYRGGRSGVVPIRLLLALLWKCSAPPFSTSHPARGWATLLDLDDPAGKGARRVREALTKLESHGLIVTESTPGQVPKVTLLQEDGSGRAYRPPAEAYQKAQTNRRGKAAVDAHRYFKVNNALWTEGHLQALSGPALVMLLILLSEQGGEGKPVWFSTSEFDRRYGLSSRTRATGVRELTERGLVVVERASLPTRPGGSAFDRRRYRDVYRLAGTALVDAEARAAFEAWIDAKRLPEFIISGS